MFYTYINLDFPLDKILLLSNGNNLTGLYFCSQKNSPKIDHTWTRNPDLDIFKSTITQLKEYTLGKRHEFTAPHALLFGTDFQKKVWQEITKIPYGKTFNYTAIAESIGKPKNVRAVASAIAKNPISIIIPCHRIIGKNGKLTGYAGGLERKQALLAQEKIDLAPSLKPKKLANKNKTT